MIEAINKVVSRFDYFYIFVMVIYMGQATPETSRMVTTLSGNPVPLLFPIILTYILCKRNKVSFRNKRFLGILAIYGLWAIFSLLKYEIFTTEELSYHFFMVYAIIIAYIQNQIYGYRLLPIYERVMVWFCKIALFFWIIVLLIPASTSFFRLFQETNMGNNVLYIFTLMDPVKGLSKQGILRNAGCSWEPGRFAIMLTLDIFCNLCQNGIKFRKNSNIWWLLLALISTMSTTGFVSVLVTYSIFLIRKINLKSIFIFLFVMLPIVYGISQLDFMFNKINDKIIKAQDVSYLEDSFEWAAKTMEKGQYRGSIDRLDAIPFEWMNLMNDPILGYSRNFEHSFFRTHITTNYALANGLVKILGMYGFILGIFFFIILFLSSRKLAEDSYEKRTWGLAILICLSAISYQILSIPIFTTFWFYGVFNPQKKR